MILMNQKWPKFYELFSLLSYLVPSFYIWVFLLVFLQKKMLKLNLSHDEDIPKLFKRLLICPGTTFFFLSFPFFEYTK